MTFNEVLERFKTKAEIAKQLGVTYQAVQQWEEADKVPLGRQFQIELITNGQLKASEQAA